jgi:hypothetical protein
LVSWPGQALLEAPPVKEIKNDSPVKPPSKKTPSAQAKKAQPGPAHKGPVKAGLERGGKKSKPRLPPGGEPGPSPVTVECLADSAKRFELPMSLLVLVLAVESGRVGEVSKNANGTYDMGPMQINSFWLPLLTKMGLSEKTVTDNGCVNLAVGAWILRSHLKRSKSLPQALSDYHSLNPERGKKYLRAAKRKLKNLDLAKTLEWVNQSLAEGDRPVLPKPAPIGELDGQTLKL